MNTTRRSAAARRATEAWRRIRAARVEDYAELRALGETREQAAARLGVTPRTAYRYDRTLREQAEQAQAVAS